MREGFGEWGYVLAGAFALWILIRFNSGAGFALAGIIAFSMYVAFNRRRQAGNN